ncbi:hypothetical protein ASG54_09490 [Aureimonas sp. Leaf460]|nr:hypothetical protein ASG62_06890 [Aureimonas sp. Leaf427]KQT79256.1 hypothetical protein ASG54_09490 [Aureimonas sp. Leaf460]
MNVETNTTAEAGPATATPESIAGLMFEPWVRDETTAEPPSNEEWKALGKDHLPIVRLAWITMFSTKAKLVEGFVDHQDMMMRLTEDCRHSVEFFRSFVTLLEAAEVRLLVAASASIDEAAA